MRFGSDKRVGYWLFALAFGMGCGLVPAVADVGAAARSLTVERRESPVFGVDASRPRFGWKLPDGVKRQTAWEIEADGWSSGKVVSSRSVDVEWAGEALRSSERVGWRVRFWDENGEVHPWSERAEFVTGFVRPEDVEARWIGMPGNGSPWGSVVFSREFAVTGKVARAVLHVVGLGFYVAELNGRRVGDKVLDPSPTDYDDHVLYSTYPVEGLLRTGENRLAVEVGHGWYDVRTRCVWQWSRAPWRGALRLMAQLELFYADGSRETIVTDAHGWTVGETVRRYDDIREGEFVDFTFVPPPAVPAVTVPSPTGRLAAESQPGARVVRTLRPDRAVKQSDGSLMLVFPENFAGGLRLRLRGQPAGAMLILRYDEIVGPGFTPAEERRIDVHSREMGSQKVFPENAAFQTDRVIAGGRDEVFESRFVYHGFQYVWLRGWQGEFDLSLVEGLVIRTDFPVTGCFESSDPEFNELFVLADRSYQANFTDGVPTDCPHREKNGWTGDAAIVAELAQYAYENTAGYEKWVRDVIDTQQEAGNISCLAPTAGWGYGWRSGPAWDAALTMLPWTLWRYRGDRRVLETAYPALCRYVEWTSRHSESNGLNVAGFGDWCAVDPKDCPETRFTSSCYWFAAQRVAELTARELGREEEAKHFAAMAAKTRESFVKRYYRGNGVWGDETGRQTSLAMALAFGMVPEGEVAATHAALVAECERLGEHVNCGNLGFKHLLRALSMAGRTDIAYRTVMNPTCPSPLASWLRAGATTLWEDWHGRHSLNHIMLGEYVSWAYQYLAGIRLAAADDSTAAVPTGPTGFSDFVLEPELVDGLDWVRASTETPYGRIESSWARSGDMVEYSFTVPPNTSAVIRLPGESDERVTAGRYRIFKALPESGPGFR